MPITVREHQMNKQNTQIAVMRSEQRKSDYT